MRKIGSLLFFVFCVFPSLINDLLICSDTSSCALCCFMLFLFTYLVSLGGDHARCQERLEHSHCTPLQTALVTAFCRLLSSKRLQLAKFFVLWHTLLLLGVCLARLFQMCFKMCQFSCVVSFGCLILCTCPTTLLSTQNASTTFAAQRA